MGFIEASYVVVNCEDDVERERSEDRDDDVPCESDDVGGETPEDLNDEVSGTL